MSDHVPPTDDELEDIERRARSGYLFFTMQAARAVPRLIAALRASRAETERLRAAVEFYANEANWQSRIVEAVPVGYPNALAQVCESGPAWDGGVTARKALA